MSLESLMESPLVRRVTGLVVVAAALIFVARYSAPDAVAARHCATRYRAALTAADSAALDPVRTLTRGGVVARHACGELRLAGRTK